MHDNSTIPIISDCRVCLHMGKLMKLNGTREENAKKENVDDKSCRLIFYDQWLSLSVLAQSSPQWVNTLDDTLSSCGQELDLRTIEFFFFFFYS